MAVLARFNGVYGWGRKVLRQVQLQHCVRALKGKCDVNGNDDNYQET